MTLIPPAVRILPMSGDEFQGQSAEQVQSEFFIQELPSRKAARYYYRTSGLNAEPGTLVLFQYANTIIASALFDSNERFDEPEGEYNGELRFDACSVRIFDPIDADTMSEIWGTEFTGFGNVKAKLSPDKYLEFERRLSAIQTPPKTSM